MISGALSEQETATRCTCILEPDALSPRHLYSIYIFTSVNTELMEGEEGAQGLIITVKDSTLRGNWEPGPWTTR